MGTKGSVPVMSTPLHKRTIAYDYGDADRGALMRKVWEPTPWMLDSFTGRCGEARERDILHWCYDTFGDQASPIHERAGVWQRGSATINGWTWFGFSTEQQMHLFATQWPAQAEEQAKHDQRAVA